MGLETAAEHGFGSETGTDKLPAGSRKCQWKLGNQPEHPFAYHGSGKILEEARGNGYITRRRVPLFGSRGLLPGRKFPPGRDGTPMKAQTAGTEQREVLDIRQAADYLGISPDTLYKYASEGFVPAFKLGNRWRFKRSRLNDWMDQQSSGGNMPVARVEERPSRAKAKPVQSVRPARRKSAAQ
jgi:excisionase family DNA binding protein